jgi:hypothetical protein
MGKRKERDLNIKTIKYFLIDQVLYWKDPLGKDSEMFRPTGNPKYYV